MIVEDSRVGRRIYIFEEIGIGDTFFDIEGRLYLKIGDDADSGNAFDFKDNEQVYFNNDASVMIVNSKIVLTD